MFFHGKILFREIMKHINLTLIAVEWYNFSQNRYIMPSIVWPCENANGIFNGIDGLEVSNLLKQLFKNPLNLLHFFPSQNAHSSFSIFIFKIRIKKRNILL